MRICYLSTDPGIPVGGRKGGSVHVGQMVNALVEEGAEVLLLAAVVEDVRVATPRLTVEVLPGPEKFASAAERLAGHDQRARWLVDRLDEFRPDVIYERLALYSSIGSVAARELNVPYIVELNAPLLEEAARFRTLEAAPVAEGLESATLRAADVVLPVSAPLADYASRRGAKFVEIAQNAAAIEDFMPSEQRNDPPIAVFAGSLRPWHGLETIAEAWRLLGDDALPLLVIGDGPARHALNGSGARMTGPVTPAEVAGLLSTADIALAPYGRDTPRYFSPIKLFEYLAAGLATIVGDLPAVTSVVDRDTAVVIPAGDANALAQAISHLARNPALRRRLGRNGRALVVARHTWRHRARRVIELAGELMTVGPVASGAVPP